ncbi:hypothetical protein LEMA_P016100.1 [Plenodomus lingam JN3]|uniref:SGNH hydrolase-type esterase domain-containing protein n=1 Tax=Leptosphaeria maculans (strain JN3 / isolate v23.1.3 / race Av1-4-5-6-7-8) TaxID=985895 RepID=E5A9Y9_LEPMJ|nr:hypothetical protein LEMA_P016100.1 [Plenodomus lingam JN3]CBY00480.1 hypothetical protein LEMA_P016100.1 [Plenodomus lingam JN3]
MYPPYLNTAPKFWGRKLRPILLSKALAYPQPIAQESDAPAKFIFGAMGDSWGSGVSWSSGTQYDDNSDNCMRYKYAWSTVVNNSYDRWTPKTDQTSQFEFQACSGARLEDMPRQMDKMTRPKLVLMEAGGNNADFYPMAEACLFRNNRDKDYGKFYEDDDPEKPEGQCRREIGLVRGRLTNPASDPNERSVKDKVIDTIKAWRYHPSVGGNEASLFVLGYPWFFGLDSACNDWTFSVVYAKEKQKVVSAMRQEFNDLINMMNTAIREAVESYNDEKIQYIDINPAFHQHRFCEPGHSRLAQFNWGDDVWLWNSPGRWVTIKNGDGTTTYDTIDGTLPPADVVNALLDHPVDSPREDGGCSVQVYQDPANPDTTMEWKACAQDYVLAGSNAGGSIARTLHPTQSGHAGMGDIIIQRLEQYYGRTDDTTIILPTPNCPFGCDCSGIVPVCT